MTHVSPKGRELIERNEGLRLNAYPDPASGSDPWTIGFGDTGPDVVEGLTITREQATERLTNRLAREFEPAVPPGTQGQVDAMISLAYNIGVGNFKKSSVLQKHLAGDFAGAADAFALWNRAAGRELPGLTRRRAEEAELYLSDTPVDDEAAVEPAPLIAPETGTPGHQKALAGGLAVQCTSLFDKFQAMFTGIHMEIDTIMLVAAVAVALLVWKINASHKGS